jgi:hypothetical protein
MCRMAAGSGIGDAMQSIRLALTALKQRSKGCTAVPVELLCCRVPLYLEMASLHKAAYSQAVVCSENCSSNPASCAHTRHTRGPPGPHPHGHRI